MRFAIVTTTVVPLFSAAKADAVTIRFKLES
jgi:hypothetical protein